jgi:hypothetical protein
MESRNTVTAAELDAVLLPRSPRYPLSRITSKLSDDAVCELATETVGSTVTTVQGLIDGVIWQHAPMLDGAALAALHAVAYYHVPKLQDKLNARGGGLNAH